MIETNKNVFAERRCTYGKLTYEKTTGYELIRAQPYRLYSLREGGIVGNCGRRCESDTRCMGFNMDYNRNECQAVIKNSKNNLFNLRPSSGVSFFEAICLKGKVTFTNTFYIVRFRIPEISSEPCELIYHVYI